MIKPQGFTPSAAMQLYAFQRAKLGNLATERAISQKIGITPETISRWKARQGFSEWLEEKISVYRAPILEILEQVALEQIQDYRFWEAMAEKYGFKQPQVDGLSNALRMVPTNEQIVEIIKKQLEERHHGQNGFREMGSAPFGKSPDASRLERGVSGGSNGGVGAFGKEEG